MKMRHWNLWLLLWFGTATAQPTTTPPPAAAKTVQLTLSRAVLNEVLDQGPQRFIAALKLDPHMERGRFLGWRIGGFAATSRFANTQHVFAGDVIVAVNDEPLERPEQFMRAWEVVRNASELKVTLIRQKVKWTYRWKIQP
ncbi:MAG: hypothetical protein VX589_11620 [Myxococcota bacterium]|nr:hypothetical protein [Myxococcota bacterium]